MSRIFDAILVCGGSGLRMGNNKIFLPLGEECVLRRVADTFSAAIGLNKLIIVLKNSDIPAAQELLSDISCIEFVAGGSNRTESVENGLSKATAQIVLIHDGARPFVTSKHISNIVEETIKYGSAVPAIPLTDSVRKCTNNTVVGTFNRDDLYTVSTPQGYITSEIKKAFSLREDVIYTDESELYSAKISPAHIIAGDPNNRKLTTPADYISTQLKIGCGYDLHTMKTGNAIHLCGITIPCEYAIVAHSDGDVCLHSLIDAMLSAVGERDIGSHFPDTDAKYKGISSELLLIETQKICLSKNKKIQSINMIVIADKPKMQPYITAMRDNISKLTSLPSSAISIAAKTTENTQPNTIACQTIITTL